MANREKPYKQIAILTIIIAVTLITLYVVYLFIPQLSVIQAKTQLVKEKTDYLAKMERGYRNYSQLEEQAADLSTQISVLENEILKGMDKPEIVLAVYSTAKQSGVQPVSLSFETLEDQGTYVVLPLDFSCEGPYDKVMAFIQELQQGAQYFFTLDSMNYKQQGDKVNAKMRLLTYFYKVE
ncbi:MAG: type 4a pilus biogenesis protein PilO [Peptococcaceae bacterium]|nr:type 4a pilus biogenesis protein PilO [Peptococcaceae bacterium]